MPQHEDLPPQIALDALDAIYAGPAPPDMAMPYVEGRSLTVDVVADHQDAVAGGDARERDEAHERGDAERLAGNDEGGDAADERERHVEHDLEGDRSALVVREEQDEVDDVFHVYDFRLVERQSIDGQPMIVVDFSPKPGAAPKTDDGKMLTKARGRAWVSEDDYELARLEAEMIADVPVGLFLAKLYKGTTISVDRRKVNGEVWLPARVRLNLSGRALGSSNALLDALTRGHSKVDG